MLFNSIEFILFLPIIFTLYWLLKDRLTSQNALLILASYVFYGWWDARFLSLIILSTSIDYFVGINIERNERKSIKRRWLLLSIITNIGILGFFKYYNFFVDSWIEMWEAVGYSVDPWSIKIILPVGISFYTFQTMSYSFDVYNKNINASKDFIGFAAFVSFFPQLVAGPIERGKNLLPQIQKPKKFDYAQGEAGLRLIVWGFFKKLVIADNLAPTVNEIFANYESFEGGTLILGVILFAFQIYCDFSGYSDIAIGTSKLFGIELMSNFKFPYFSRSIAEFWRRWHISLSTWFRDYLYIPLGGSRKKLWGSIRNIFIIFLVSGFWHGANWTFIVWGLIHAILFIPLFLFGSNRTFTKSTVAENRLLPNLKEVLQIGLTFSLVTFAWIFFRAESLSHAISYISNISIGIPQYKSQLLYPIVLLILEWTMRKNERTPFYRFSTYWVLLIFVLIISTMKYFDQTNIEFIYFQF